MDCECNYDEEGNVIALCEPHFEVRRLNSMMDDMWNVLRDRNKTFNIRVSDTMRILRDK